MKKNIVLFLAFIPFFIKIPWITTAWRISPLDRIGPVFVLIAALISVLNWSRMKKIIVKPDHWGLLLTGLGVLGMLTGLAKSLNSVFTIFSLLFVYGLIWFFQGWAWTVILSPLLGLLMLSIPTTTYLIGLVLSPLMAINMVALFIVKLCISGGLVGSLYGLIHYQEKQNKPPFSVQTAIYFLIFAGILLVLGQGKRLVIEIGPTFQPQIVGGQVGAWSGMEMKLDPAEVNFFKGTDTSKFIYFDGSGLGLNVIKVAAGPNVTKIHAPEYCLTGGGWQIDSRGLLYVSLGEDSLPVSRIKVRKDNQIVYLYYWFSSKDASTPGHTAFRKLYNPSEQSDWEAFQVAVAGTRSGVKADESFRSFVAGLFKQP